MTGDDLEQLNRELDAAEVSQFERAVTTMKADDLARVTKIVTTEAERRVIPDFGSMSDFDLDAAKDKLFGR